jgi:hypothetical protein
MKPTLPLLAVLVLGVSAPAPARAADVDPAVAAAANLKAAAAELDAAVKAKDEAAVGAAAKKISGLYKDTEDAAARAAAAKALAGAIKNPKVGGARSEALAALVETEDAKEGGKALLSAYPADDVFDETKFNAEIVKALAHFHPEPAIDRLLETFKKAKQAELSAAAVTALGGYNASKQREKILAEVVKIAKNLQPGSTKDKAASPEAMERWGIIGGAIGPALDKLTNTRVGDTKAWIKKVDETKGSLKSLFAE